jgi:UDP-glucose 4-epimerase
VNVGITGYSGFIGGSVAQYLSSRDCQVISLDRYTRSALQNCSFEEKCPDDFDWILHFAASTSIPKSFNAPFSTYHNNLDATLLALKIAHLSQAAFLYMSSYVYGTPKYLPIDEKHPLASSNPYMGSKIIGENLCQQLSGIVNIPLVILRGFKIYGNYTIPGRFISDLLDCVRKGEPIRINDPVPKRDYLYIKDFNRLIFEIISQNPIKTGTFNVGYGQSYANRDVAEIVRQLSSESRPITITSQRRQNDVLDCVADITLIKETFSWSPEYSLEEGLKELIINITQDKT